MPTYVAIPLLTALSVTQAAVQPPCEGWATEVFWRTADPALVRECLAAGYSVHERLGLSRTVLHMAAAFSDDAEVIAVLVEAGADLAASFPPLNRTPLHTAARYNRNPEIARVLLRYGADVNAVNELGRTPLHLAALFNDNPAVVEELARATDVNCRRPDPEGDATTGSDQGAVPAVDGDLGSRGSGRAHIAGISGWCRCE